MKRDQFVSLFFVVLLIFVAYQVLLILSPFIQSIFWAAILAFGFYPVYERVEKRIPNQTAAALIMTFFIFLIVIPPVVLLFMNVSGQAIQLYQTVSDYVRQGRLEKLIEDIRGWSVMHSFEERVVSWEPFKQHATDWLLGSAKSIGNYTASQAGTISKNIFFTVLNIGIITFLLFIFLKDGKRIYDFIYQIAPLEEKNKSQIAGKINETLSAVIRGQLVTAMTQAIIAGLFFWIIGIPAPLFFGIMTFIMAMIPVVGASTVWFPLVLYLVTIDAKVKAAILFLFGMLVISLVDNILKPALIGEKTKLPYFLLFFGILGGLKLYGLMGIFVAPVMLSLFFSLVKIYQEN